MIPAFRSLIHSLLLLACLNVSAAEFAGKVETIAAGPGLGDTVYVRVVNHSASAPWSIDCSSHPYWSFRFDATTAGGWQSYSLALEAYTSGKTVVINGTGECTDDGTFSNVQDMLYLRFAQ